jgi:16S rRNA processing protein RimM
MDSTWVELGRLGRTHGLHGWLHVQSFCDPPEALFDHPIWSLGRPRIAPAAPATAGARAEMLDLQPVRWLERRVDGGRLRVRLEGVEGVESAASWVGASIVVARSALPAAAPGTYYRADLIGFRVLNTDGVDLGVLDHFIDAPAQPVMRVIDTRADRPVERLIPVTPQHLVRVQVESRELTVDWPETL